jgi:hypothetical protein
MPDSRQRGSPEVFDIHVHAPDEIVVTPCPAPLMTMFLSLMLMPVMEQEPAPMLTVSPVAEAEIAVLKADVMSPLHVTLRVVLVNVCNVYDAD